jgi:hypothetical protein
MTAPLATAGVAGIKQSAGPTGSANGRPEGRLRPVGSDADLAAVLADACGAYGLARVLATLAAIAEARGPCTCLDDLLLAAEATAVEEGRRRHG